MPRLQKKSVTLSGHETSLALEPAFWAVLQAVAGERGVSLAQFVRHVDETRGADPLASACRLAALGWALQGRAARVEASADPALQAGDRAGGAAGLTS